MILNWRVNISYKWMYGQKNSNYGKKKNWAKHYLRFVYGNPSSWHSLAEPNLAPLSTQTHQLGLFYTAISRRDKVEEAGLMTARLDNFLTFSGKLPAFYLNKWKNIKYNHIIIKYWKIVCYLCLRLFIN